MPSTKFTYKDQEFEINSQKLYIDFKRHGVLTIHDFNEIFDREDVKNNVTVLDLNNFYGLKQIPENVFNLTNLRVLQIINCKNISVLVVEPPRSHGNVSAPYGFGKLTNLQDLILHNTNLKELHETLKDAPSLKLLELESNPLASTIKNFTILRSIYNNGNKPTIRVDDGFGGLQLVNGRVYKTGLRKDTPFRQNMLLQSDFDKLLPSPTFPPTPPPLPAKEKTPKKLSRSSSNSSNRTKRSRSSSNHSNGTQRSRSS